MSKKNINVNDVRQSQINSQYILSGSNLSHTLANASFFVWAILGSNITLTDANSNTIIVATNLILNQPIRVEGGISISSGYCLYSVIPFSS